MNEKIKVYQYLVSKGYSPVGASAIIGNLIAESNCDPHNVEDRCYFSDDEYTNRVDAGTYSEHIFANDSFGYGLAQWTFFTRKRKLYDLCKSKGVSISDLDTQCEFLVSELQHDYLNLSNALKNPAGNLYDLTARFMCEFENPLNQSDSAVRFRVSLAQGVYDELFNNTLHANGPCVPKLRTCDWHCTNFPEYQIIQSFILWYFGSDEYGFDFKQDVMDFQSLKCLSPDGVVGPITWSKIADVIKEGVQY